MLRVEDLEYFPFTVLMTYFRIEGKVQAGYPARAGAVIRSLSVMPDAGKIGGCFGPIHGKVRLESCASCHFSETLHASANESMGSI